MTAPSPTKLAVAGQVNGGSAAGASMELERLRRSGARGTSSGQMGSSPQGRAGLERRGHRRGPDGGKVSVASAQLLTTFAAGGGQGRRPIGEVSASEKGARSATEGLRLADRPAPSSPITVPPGERLIDGQEVISVGAPWNGGSLDASTSQRVPFALGGLILIFVFVQWLIDRRDPKFVEAPARKHEDSIGFE
jgi:hypothetical protein